MLRSKFQIPAGLPGCPESLGSSQWVVSVAAGSLSDPIPQSAGGGCGGRPNQKLWRLELELKVKELKAKELELEEQRLVDRGPARGVNEEGPKMPVLQRI